MRVYTKTGDQGTTSLASGTRVPKYHERLEVYGTIDELNSHIGLVRTSQNDPDLNRLFRRIQNRIFTISSNLALDKEEYRNALPAINNEDVQELEDGIDTMLDQMPELKSFILPAGTAAAAACHIARTVCRRAERHMVKIAESIEVDSNHLKYINRLSDFLFVVARKITHDQGQSDEIWFADYEARGN